MNTPRFLSVLAILALAANLCSAQGNRRNGGGNSGGGGEEAPAAAAPLQAVPRNNPQIVYPYDFALAGTEGTAELTYDVTETGLPQNIKIVRASKPEFGQSIAAAIQTVRFTPPEKDGKAVAVKAQPLKFNFTKAAIDAAMVDEVKKPVAGFVTASQVNGGLKWIHLAEPIFPDALMKTNVNEGRAEVQIIIDKDGSVHLPRVTSATREEFGWAAASCVMTWRFVPPVDKDGKPVMVRLTLPFPFYKPGSAPAAAAAAAASQSAPPAAKK